MSDEQKIDWEQVENIRKAHAEGVIHWSYPEDVECLLRTIDILKEANDNMAYPIGWFLSRYEKMGQVNVKTAYEVFKGVEKFTQD